MTFLLLLVAAVVVAATEPTNGVHRLPITRTIIELDWRWLGADSLMKHHLTVPKNQQPLSQRFHKRMNTNGRYSRKIPRRPSKSHRFGGEDDIDFWSIYTVPIQLGNPPLNLDALLDTSWSPFFVPSAKCTYNARKRNACIIHPLYNSSLSSTYRADLSPCKMTYWGMQGIRTYGRISSDSLHISDIEIKGQVFEEATRWEPGLLTDNEDFDTVLGLSLYPTYDEWGNFSAPGPFQNMITQQLLNENIFSLTLPRKEYEQGEIVFGSLPANVSREDLIEIPLNNTRRGEDDAFFTSNGWQVSVSEIGMMSSSSDEFLPILAGEQQIAIVTASVPYIGLSPEAARIANKLIGLPDGGTWVDCNTRSSLPDLVFTFGAGKQVRLTARDYLLEVYDVVFQRQKCVTTFGSLGDDGMILLGSPFLTGLYSVFDADRKSISFGNK